jgi:hypothetical protein
VKAPVTESGRPTKPFVIDVRGFTAKQRQSVRVVASAIAANLLPDLAALMANGTALEVPEEAARRLRDLRCLP